MEFEIVNTKDGSKSVYSKHFDAAFHSWYGAVTENKHVYIENGLKYKHMEGNDALKVLEIGYGTGLNAMLSAVYAIENDLDLIYSGIDKYEFPKELFDSLNYSTFFDDQYRDLLKKINNAVYDDAVRFHEKFALIKSLGSLKETKIGENNYDIIYYDAFSPRQVPHMWTKEVFERMFKVLRPGGILITFCAESQFKRHMKEIGFVVEELFGTPGKREMTRGTKKLE